ncbi:MAG: prephenate dehydrogenase [Lachnospiraceae bacterium]|nr:prephenate dehydrogenase [Lachnospiraceae bacterium]
MEWISKSNILIVGLGLMGGSYAKALKRLGYHVSAIDSNKDSITYALNEGIIDSGSCTIDRYLIGSADAVIFALYPEVFKSWIEKNQEFFHPGTLITDVTGVKSSVVYAIQDILRDDVEYIAAHPMAGREVYGVENSDGRMFQNANYIVTPTEKNTPEAIEWCRSLGKILGARSISVLTPEEHDEMIGFVSQLTHLIAVALMTCSDNRHLVDYTGDSFRDLTRIARINEKMWSELFLMNKDMLLAQMDRFIGEFTRIRDMLAEEDKQGLCDKMRLSTERRSWFDAK